MKKLAIIGLLLLGVFETAFPYVAVLFSDSYLPRFETQVEALKLNTQQEAFVEEAFVFLTIKTHIISYFGLLTIILGIIILLADRRRQRAA
jgi:hypothetical protein